MSGNKKKGKKPPQLDRLEQAKTVFLHLLDDLSETQQQSFARFVREALQDTEAPVDPSLEAKRQQVAAIIEELREIIPVDGQAPGEKFFFPQNEEYAGYTEQNTVHVDSFLYELDEDVDELCDKGVLSRNYCLSCGSTKVKPLNFISHSATASQLEFVFDKMLGDLKGKKLVDVGSRLGAVLYMAFLYSGCAEIVGVEKTKYFCDVQEKTLKNHHMTQRVKVVCDDIMNHAQLLGEADVVVLNNVFEFFSPGEMQEKLWKFLRAAVVKKGCKVVTIPSIEESLKNAGIASIDVKSWVKPLPVQYPDTEDEELNEDCRMIHLYEVR